jgi:flagellar biosynthesis protein FliQ
MDNRTIEFIIRLTNQGLLMVMIVCGPPILISMVVGLIISLFQAVTQIQEATLTFVPKMIVIFGTLAALGPFLGGTLLKFTELCFVDFPKYLF